MLLQTRRQFGNAAGALAHSAGQALSPAERAARSAAKSQARPALAALHDPGRLAPAVKFSSLHGKIPLPVNGIKIRDYGAPDGVGGSEKGISIATHHTQKWFMHTTKRMLLKEST